MGESDSPVLTGMQSAVSRSRESGLSQQSSELMPRALRGELDSPVLPGIAATKVIVGTGGGPGQEGGLSRQSLDSIPSRTGRTIESGMGSSLPVSTGRYVSGTTDVETRVGYATASETKSLGQGMSDHNDSGVMSSGRVVCASGRGASGCSVQSKATDSMGKRASSPLWPYPTVSQDTLSLSNGRLGEGGDLTHLPPTGSYTVESLITSSGKESPSSVTVVSRGPHSTQGQSHVRNLPGKTNHCTKRVPGMRTVIAPSKIYQYLTAFTKGLVILRRGGTEG